MESFRKPPSRRILVALLLATLLLPLGWGPAYAVACAAGSQQGTVAGAHAQAFRPARDSRNDEGAKTGVAEQACQLAKMPVLPAASSPPAHGYPFRAWRRAGAVRFDSAPPRRPRHRPKVR